MVLFVQCWRSSLWSFKGFLVRRLSVLLVLLGCSAYSAVLLLIRVPRKGLVATIGKLHLQRITIGTIVCESQSSSDRHCRYLSPNHLLSLELPYFAGSRRWVQGTVACSHWCREHLALIGLIEEPFQRPALLLSLQQHFRNTLASWFFPHCRSPHKAFFDNCCHMHWSA